VRGIMGALCVGVGSVAAYRFWRQDGPEFTSTPRWIGRVVAVLTAVIFMAGAAYCVWLH